MIGSDFKFNKRWLSEFGMKMYAPDEEQSFAGKEVIKSSQSPIRGETKHYATQYSDVLYFNILIMRDNDICVTQSEYLLTSHDITQLRSWLESSKRSQEFCLIDDTNDCHTYYYGVFIDIQPYLINDCCYGLKLKFECDAPYGFSEEENVRISLTSDETTQYTESILSKSAELNNYTYPKIILSASDDGFAGDEILSLKNNAVSLDKFDICLSKNLLGKRTVVVDCKEKMVYDENGDLIPMSEIGYALNEVGDVIEELSLIRDIPWFALCCGVNNIDIDISEKGNLSSVTITFRDIMKAGGF